MFDRRYDKQVAITGIGQSEVGRPSSLSAMRLTLDACLEAIADAGLERSDIDGVACWPGDNNNGAPFSPVGPSALKSTLGLNVNWFGAGYEGPGPLAGVINAAMAIEAGLCKHVLVFRTITEASARMSNKQAGALTNKTQGRDSSFAWQSDIGNERCQKRGLARRVFCVSRCESECVWWWLSEPTCMVS